MSAEDLIKYLDSDTNSINNIEDAIKNYYSIYDNLSRYSS